MNNNIVNLNQNLLNTKLITSEKIDSNLESIRKGKPTTQNLIFTKNLLSDFGISIKANSIPKFALY